MADEIQLPQGLYQVGWDFGQIISFDVDFDEDDCDCKHEWKNYIGLTEAFKYCVKCDEKRDIDGNT